MSYHWAAVYSSLPNSICIDLEKVFNSFKKTRFYPNKNDLIYGISRIFLHEFIHWVMADNSVNHCDANEEITKEVTDWVFPRLSEVKK